jgi:hypothetical protein
VILVARIFEPGDITVASSDHNGGKRTGGLEYESLANAADTLVLGEVATR